MSLSFGEAAVERLSSGCFHDIIQCWLMLVTEIGNRLYIGRNREGTSDRDGLCRCAKKGLSVLPLKPLLATKKFSNSRLQKLIINIKTILLSSHLFSSSCFSQNAWSKTSHMGHAGMFSLFTSMYLQLISYSNGWEIQPQCNMKSSYSSIKLMSAW